MINLEKELEEMKELISIQLDRFLTNEVESYYIRSYIELLKIQAILLIYKEKDENIKYEKSRNR